MDKYNIISKIAAADMADPRARIMTGAIEEFAKMSLEGSRTRRIAAKAGVNSAAISYYFGGKSGLYKAVIDQTSAYFDDAVKPYYDEGNDIIKRRDSKGALSLAKRFLVGCIKKFSEVSVVSDLSLILLREADSPSRYFKRAYESLYSYPVEFLSKLLQTASKGKLEHDISLVYAQALWGHVRTYSSKAKAVMKLHRWSRFGKKEIGILEEALGKVLEKTLG